MSDTTQSQHCGKCGATLSGYAPDGLCAACLLASAFEERDAVSSSPIKPGPLLAFKDYELLEEIARGGMGVVYRARQISLNRTVAIKMILGGHLANAAEVKRFRAEAETAAQLQHPNIVAIHEVGEHAGQPFFSMDLVEGQNLAQLVRNEPLPARKAVIYLKAIAEAVQYAHSRGVLHRDLKPSNIVIDQNDQPRITDFGLAKRLTDSQPSNIDPQLTQTGQILGSPSFIPPEQAAGQKAAIGPASDVYSLGAILYHCLTGRPPFMAETMTQTLRMVAEQEPVSPRLLNAGVPSDLETICLKCLEKEPAKRYASAQELTDDLNRFLRDEPIRARPVGRIERVHRWCLRNKMVAATGTAALALLLLVAIGSPIAAFRINRERLQSEASRQQAIAEEAIAKREAAKSQQVAKFLNGILQGIGPSTALGRDTTMLREILDRAEQRVGKELTNQPEAELEIRVILHNAYVAMGDYGPRKHEMARAIAQLTRSHPFPPRVAGQALLRLGQDLLEQGKLEEAEATTREAIAKCRTFEDKNQSLIFSLCQMARILRARGLSAQSEPWSREALKLAKESFGDQSVETAKATASLADSMSSEGRLSEAESLWRQALTMQHEVLGYHHYDVKHTIGNLVENLCAQSKQAEAEALLKRELVLWTNHNQPDAMTLLYRLSRVLQAQGKLGEAETAAREALTGARKTWAATPRMLAFYVQWLGSVLLLEGKTAEAESLDRESAEIQRKVAARGDPRSLNEAAWFFATCPNPAVRDGPTAISLGERAATATKRLDAAVLDTLAAAYAEAGQFTNAVAVQKEAMALVADGGDKGVFAARLKLYESNTPYHEK